MFALRSLRSSYSAAKSVAAFPSSSRRHFVKVGDVVPINFIKDEKPPVIMADKDYPDWVFQLTDKAPTRPQLLAKFGESGEGSSSMTEYELRRLKRLITLQTIKDNNAAALTEKQ